MRPTRALLVRAANLTGYPVKAAWSSHSKGTMGDVLGVVEHHTGTGVNYARLDDYPTLRVVRDGRPGLANSLSAYGLGRSGTIYCISEKLSWHAGNARWGGTSDVNGHYLGIEAESDGTYWSDAQEDAYPRLVAAILHVFGRGAGDHPRHAEVALPKGRKTDWAGLDDAGFDRQVRAYLANPASINRNYAATPAAVKPPEDDVEAKDMWEPRQPIPADLKAEYPKGHPGYAPIRLAYGNNVLLNRLNKQLAAQNRLLERFAGLLADGNTVQPDELRSIVREELDAALPDEPIPSEEAA